tara:strand:- start:814 stop:1206 length:393 start_codon:yes stop_codon:yes gene_type:complete
MDDSIEVSCVIASHSPRQLAAFYANLNHAEIFQGINNNHFFILIKDGFKIEFYKPSKYGLRPKQGTSCSLCFKKQANDHPLKVLNDWTEHLSELGGRVISQARVESFGAEIWVVDPEENQFLLLVINLHG